MISSARELHLPALRTALDEHAAAVRAATEIQRSAGHPPRRAEPSMSQHASLTLAIADASFAR